MKAATRELRTQARRPRRWVLSCEPTLLMRWLIPRWPQFQALAPDIDVHLVAGGGPFRFDDGIDLAIRRNDFALPPASHAEKLFAERVGPVCHPARVGAWFDGPALHPQAPRLHSQTRPDAWITWSRASGQPGPGTHGQTFDHFYFSLQAAVAGLGVAIGPWPLVRDDIESGVLAAPLGFVEDGSHYCLLSPHPIEADQPQGRLLAWLRTVA